MAEYARIGIRPIIDARLMGIREALEAKTHRMALSAQELIESNLRYTDGTPVQCVIFSGSIGCSAEAEQCAREFSGQNICATLSITPSWCYGYETLDMDPQTVKAVWGFNGTERPGAVYLACAMAAYNQIGLPAFSIYGHDVQDMDDDSIPGDVAKKILQFARCALAVGAMRGKSYVGIGSVSMGIMGSFCDPHFYQEYLGMRSEWIDMSEVIRRESLGIYDHEEYKKAAAWVKAHCPEGHDPNPPERQHTREEKDQDWSYVIKMTLIFRDLLQGNPRLAEAGWQEESIGRNGLLGGFQGQRMWTDFMPNGDFSEAILNSSFDWNGSRAPIPFATENDGLNGVSMLFATLLTNRASLFADIRTYWSPDAVRKNTGWTPDGMAQDGFIHLINSGSAALDATGAALDKNGNGTIKPYWELTQEDIDRCLSATDWCPAERCQFRGGGFSSHFRTNAVMPMTMIRINLVHGLGPVLQLAEGYSIVLPERVHQILDKRTDPTWPTTWFAPILTGEGAFKDTYSVMANWGANHGACAYGHIGSELITLASMLRIPVAMHNVSEERIFRPHSWSAFGTKALEHADFAACSSYGPLYRP